MFKSLNALALLTSLTLGVGGAKADPAAAAAAAAAATAAAAPGGGAAAG